MPLFLVSGAKGTRMLRVNFFRARAPVLLESAHCYRRTRTPTGRSESATAVVQIAAEDTPGGNILGPSDRVSEPERVAEGASASSLAYGSPTRAQLS